jgi:hypothetical protein
LDGGLILDWQPDIDLNKASLPRASVTGISNVPDNSLTQPQYKKNGRRI